LLGSKDGPECSAGLEGLGDGLFRKVREVSAVEGAGLFDLELFVGALEDGVQLSALGWGDLELVETAFEGEWIGGEESDLGLDDVQLLSELGELRAGGNVLGFGGEGCGDVFGAGDEMIDVVGSFSRLVDEGAEFGLVVGEVVDDLLAEIGGDLGFLDGAEGHGALEISGAVHEGKSCLARVALHAGIGGARGGGRGPGGAVSGGFVFGEGFFDAAGKKTREKGGAKER